MVTYSLPLYTSLHSDSTSPETHEIQRETERHRIKEKSHNTKRENVIREGTPNFAGVRHSRTSLRKDAPSKKTLVKLLCSRTKLMKQLFFAIVKILFIRLELLKSEKFRENIIHSALWLVHFSSKICARCEETNTLSMQADSHNERIIFLPFARFLLHEPILESFIFSDYLLRFWKIYRFKH